MTSADFYTFSTVSQQWLLFSEHFAQASLGTTHFFPSIHLLHLLYVIPCSYWASCCNADLSSCTALYTGYVHQTGGLPVVSLFPHPASFRFHLSMDTFVFDYILPATEQIRDLYPLETCVARRTLKMKEADTNFRFPIFNLLDK